MFEYHNFILKHYYRSPTADCSRELELIGAHRDQFAAWSASIPERLHQLAQRKENILFEGAQGTLLDIDHGTYPYVTSSNTIAANACCGGGLAMQRIDYVLGISKAYATRVGNGPFPTELKDERGDYLSLHGKERGATTGRERRCGWLDAVALKRAIQLNGVNYLCLTKIDILTGLERLRICDGYDCASSDLSKCIPRYIELAGWSEPVQGITRYRHLPLQARRYIECIEQLTGTAIDMISTGPDREENIVRKAILKARK